MKFTLRAAIVVAVFCAVSANVTVPLKRKRIVNEYINTQYVGEIAVGQQTFEVVFDTSSYNLVLPCESCLSPACQCPGTAKYQKTSNTKCGPSNEVVSVPILDTGCAKGTQASDCLNISSLYAPEQGFVLATDISIEICILGADGVAGLGRPGSGKAAFNQPTVFETFVNLHEIECVFTIHHARLPNGDHYGVITFGGVIESYYTGEFTCVPLVDDSTWNFKLDFLRVGNDDVITDAIAFIDSSKNVVVGPTLEINKINEALGCTNTVISDINICQFDCSQLGLVPDVIFGIGEKNFNISAEYHVQQNGDVCYSGFSPCNETNVYHIGDFFIDHYLPKFDSGNKRMGFAISTENL
ncbi:aspartic protease Bla g 2-like [Zootermopsis nevadensis]|uniref:Aspartic protease Bla g 2 n=1 Tax=Zootermopsis nevadensis TaxID=136037 RepID=A0A067RU39_ZOONE|nr:aspartic protease Bla g 2-like [Zootermopsis nevadensis]KDR23359.1 Aspartic protease Bla g 2 [Zootermopsis nevadensis]